MSKNQTQNNENDNVQWIETSQIIRVAKSKDGNRILFFIRNKDGSTTAFGYHINFFLKLINSEKAS